MLALRSVVYATLVSLASCGARAEPAATPTESGLSPHWKGVQPPSEVLQEVAAAAARGSLPDIERIAAVHVEDTPCADTQALLQGAHDLLPGRNNELLCLKYRLETVRSHCAGCNELGWGLGYIAEGCEASNCTRTRTCDVDGSHRCGP